jgi:hypothetical protein
MRERSPDREDERVHRLAIAGKTEPGEQWFDESLGHAGVDEHRASDPDWNRVHRNRSGIHIGQGVRVLDPPVEEAARRGSSTPPAMSWR